MKRFLIYSLLLFFALPAFAQQKGTITGTVIDVDSHETLPGSVLTLIPKSNPDNKLYSSAGANGIINFPAQPYGDYTLSVSFLGYTAVEKSFTLNAKKVDVGQIALKSGVQLKGVETVTHALRASQRGDTISYNAGSFRVASDADVEGLLEKMPGLTVTDGVIEAQGEQVQKVFVDGKEFFGDDPQTAIKSLPAEAVDRIEVFDKLSDAAEFSGMDDGQGYKAINIITKPSMRRSIFGKVYAGYGYDFAASSDQNKYLAGGNVNMFNGDSRLTVLGLFNNVNQQNFSFDDILGVSGQTNKGGGGGNRSARQYMVRPQSGIAKVNSIGLNYSDIWGKHNQITFQGSYFFNKTTTTNYSESNRWNEAPLPIDTLFTRGNSLTMNQNHRFNARFEWKISDNQDLLVRPRFSYQTNDPLSTLDGWQFGQSGYSLTDNSSDGLRHGYNLNLMAVYRTKLGKPGRTLTLYGSVMHNNRSRGVNSSSNVMPADSIAPDLLPDGSEVPWDWDPADYSQIRYLRNLQPSNETELQGGLTYTEPVGAHEQLSFQYQISNDVQHGTQDSYITADNTYNITGLTPDPMLSNLTRSAYTTHRVGPGFRYAFNKNTVVLNANYQYASLDGNVNQNSQDQRIDHGFSNFTYFGMARLNFNPQNTLRFFLFSYTDNPDIQDLQGAFDVSDAQNITRGNPDLVPTYTNRLRAYYVNTNTDKGRTFMLSAQAQTSSNYMATHMLANPGRMTLGGDDYAPNYYSEPVNMNGYWNVRADASYGFPITPLKCNFNILASVNYTLTPSMLGGQWDNATQSIVGGYRNNASNVGYTFGAVLGSNISENVDFTVSWNGTYNVANNSAQSAGGSNRYFQHTALANMKFVLPLGFTFTGSATYTQYVGFTNKYEDDFLLCNVWIGKKVLKQQGEVMIGVTDLLNQNTAFARTTGSGWTQNDYNSALGRYYMVQFTYNLRIFGKHATRDMSYYQNNQPRRH